VEGIVHWLNSLTVAELEGVGFSITDDLLTERSLLLDALLYMANIVCYT